MNNESSTPQTAPAKITIITYTPTLGSDAVTTVPSATAAKGNDEVMSTPAKQS